MSNISNKEIFDIEVGKYITEYLGEYEIISLKFDPFGVATILVNINGYSFILNIIFLHCEDKINTYKSSWYNDSNYSNELRIEFDYKSIAVEGKVNNVFEWVFEDIENSINWRKECELINGLTSIKKFAIDIIDKIKSSEIINDVNSAFNLVDQYRKYNNLDRYDYESSAYKLLNKLKAIIDNQES